MVRYPRLLALSLVFAAKQLPAGADERGSESRAAYSTCGGKWVRAKAINRLLGYDEQNSSHSGTKIADPPTIEIVIDKTPGQTMDTEDLESIRSFVEHDKHRLVATGRFRAFGQDSECAVTQREGRTYLWRGTNVGLLPTLVSFVPGASRDRDLLFIDWLPYTPNSRSVSGFRRSAE